MNTSMLKKELDHLEQTIDFCNRLLKTLPQGRINITHNGTRGKWFVTFPECHCRRYLPKSQRKMAEKLALRRYLTSVLNDSEKSRKEITALLLRYEQSESEKMLEDPLWQDLLSFYFKPKSKVLLDWMNEPYPSNPNHPENLKFPSPTGHVLRSKSEVIIDMSLSAHKLPFRYESPLDLNGRTFYPDFTIRHPESGEFFYWEHFGMMDNADYIDDCTSKLRVYARAGIIPTVNLIATYETADHPLSPQMVSRLIEEYFF